MSAETTTRLAGATVAATGTLWGLYWLPVRRLETLGLGGAWGTLAIVAAAALLLAPLAWRRRAALARADRAGLASLALGGAAFMMYSAGLLYGRVAIVILLFFLTPVWSTLIARLALRRPVPAMRMAAIVAGLAGLSLMLGAVPVPRSTGEWLALVSGMLWAVASTGMHLRPVPGPVPAAFVFVLGACCGAAVLGPLMEPAPQAVGGGALALALVAGGLWWALAMPGLMWAVSRLEPARSGILLMSEVLVGAASAAVLAGELLGPLELAGGALVLSAALLETWPVPQARRPRN